ncbi:putative cyclin dependent kinase C [Monocercomonoides exilis]|uniref:putative cyclin dependent kinase C n=1 Tax=Monocercomonoides exilis TaxID=2049356 RepID=UPI00355AB4B5|nr:putative cyclin dependent kinase C [Monocercomonoides exilis]|eukprot:MONOS_7239.1-p1 / transcript=MONOS_7239.1 / gene=MONOS_7239 / organism=Monocercomonoides_exilis_PA203 / gene_product=cyclin dependent kinase C / transcript_product=cyclin dependent kinase C / location=Mono_scaffold00242:73645-75603(+) / protein_length=611 / sequence_SO=supercontig / SO=protein_coding / is_pseudo=false
MAAPTTGEQSQDVVGKEIVPGYIVKHLVGQGTYGAVYEAIDKSTGEIVALKKSKITNDKEGFPLIALREIKLLKRLKNPSIVELKKVIAEKDVFYYVMEYLPHDLAGLLETEGSHLPLPVIKCYMKQLLYGMHLLHRNHIVHRDIKPANLLINQKGELKLADFGFAREFDKKKDNVFTPKIITLWYRPPELLLGSQTYDTAIDMWGIGCILAEFLNSGRNVMPGNREYEQLNMIWKLCGTPDTEDWPGVVDLPYYKGTKVSDRKELESYNIRPREKAREKDASDQGDEEEEMLICMKPSVFRPRMIRQKFQHCDSQAVDLVDKLLQLNPAKRLKAHEALLHPFFWSDPLPCNPEDVPPYSVDCHSLDARNRRLEGANHHQNEGKQRKENDADESNELKRNTRTMKSEGAEGRERNAASNEEKEEEKEEKKKEEEEGKVKEQKKEDELIATSSPSTKTSAMANLSFTSKLLQTTSLQSSSAAQHRHILPTRPSAITTTQPFIVPSSSSSVASSSSSSLSLQSSAPKMQQASDFAARSSTHALDGSQQQSTNTAPSLLPHRPQRPLSTSSAFTTRQPSLSSLTSQPKSAAFQPPQRPESFSFLPQHPSKHPRE